MMILIKPEKFEDSILDREYLKFFLEDFPLGVAEVTLIGNYFYTTYNRYSFYKDEVRILEGINIEDE